MDVGERREEEEVGTALHSSVTVRKGGAECWSRVDGV